MSQLFSLFLHSHYISFPLSIWTFFSFILSLSLLHIKFFFPSHPFFPAIIFHFLTFLPLFLSHVLTLKFHIPIFFFIPMLHVLFSSCHLCPHQLDYSVIFSFILFLLFSVYLSSAVLICRVWEVTTGEVLNTLIHHNEAVLHLRFANGLMVTCSKDRSIAVWDMASPTDISLRRVLVGHRAAVNVVDFDDKYIVSASGDRTIKVTRFESLIFREKTLTVAVGWSFNKYLSISLLEHSFYVFFRPIY